MIQAEKSLVLFFRLSMGWIFLYASYQQITDPNWTAATFLGQTKTANEFFAWFASPSRVAITDFLVKWGHLLIGLSLIAGLLISIGARLGAFLMLIYYLAHLDFPYVESKDNFLVDYHLIYAGVLVYLVMARSDDTLAVDPWLRRSPFLRRHKSLRWLFE